MADRRVRRLRSQPTDAESALWRQLRAKQAAGLRFRRQFPIGPYIVDFVCLNRRLAIELDGGQHARQETEDQRRTAWLESQGFAVIRFWNNDVLANPDGVILANLVRLQGPPPT